MNNEIHIDFTESYILGWKKEQYLLKIFCEFFLLPEHPLFRVFDKKKELGCYKIGMIVVDLPTIKEGVLGDDCEPKWDFLLNEYKDIFEIELLKISDGKELRIEAEELDLLIIGEKICIKFE